MQGISDFEVTDEIYISAHEPQLQILATAEWHGKAHPMAWVKRYGKGRVFYTTLGHVTDTFKQTRSNSSNGTDDGAGGARGGWGMRPRSACHASNSSSSALASRRSTVAKPSVNH